MKKLTKFRRLFLALITLSTPLLLAAVSPGRITLSSDVYGPLTVTTDYWDFVGFLRWNNTPATVYETFTITNRDDDTTYTIETEPHDMAANGVHNVEVRLNLFWYVTTMGTDFNIKVLDANNKTVKYSIAFTLFPATRDIVQMGSYTSKYFSAKASAFMLNTLPTKVTFFQERIKFDGYCDYLQTDSYYRFKLTNFTFTYSYQFAYEDDDGLILFNDIYNLFPNIGKDRFGRPFIPLITTANGTTVTVTLGELYVNPNTLDMSTTPLIGYVPTNYFYFPMREQAKIKEYNFHGYIVGAGPGNMEYSFPLNYIETPAFFGDCIHSDYCVEEELI